MFLWIFLNYLAFYYSISIPYDLFKKDTFELNKLLCLLNDLRTSQNHIILPLGVNESLNLVAEDSLKLVSPKDEGTEFLKFPYLSSLTEHKYFWNGAGRLFTTNMNKTDDAMLSILTNKEARKVLLDSTFTHIGASYSHQNKTLSIILGKGNYIQTLPDCTNYEKGEKLRGLIDRLNKMNDEQNSLVKHIPPIISDSTPNNATFITQNSFKKENTFQPIITNSTKESRRRRFKKRLRDHPIAFWKTTRSGRAFNGAFDYDSIDSKYYKFDLIKAICYINFARKHNKPSSPPIGANLVLMDIARNHTEWMASRKILSHFGEADSTPGERILDGGIEWKSYGQNIARGIPKIEDLMNQMLTSSGHRERLLGQRYNSIGIWYVPKGSYWTILLAKAENRAPEPKNCDQYKPDFLLDLEYI